MEWIWLFFNNSLQVPLLVTMQAQKSAVPEMQCKDKFLIQTTVVPFGTTEEEITPGMVGYHYSGFGLVVCVLFGIVCCSWKLKSFHCSFSDGSSQKKVKSILKRQNSEFFLLVLPILQQSHWLMQFWCKRRLMRIWQLKNPIIHLFCCLLMQLLSKNQLMILQSQKIHCRMELKFSLDLKWWEYYFVIFLDDRSNESGNCSVLQRLRI